MRSLPGGGRTIKTAPIPNEQLFNKFPLRTHMVDIQNAVIISNPHFSVSSEWVDVDVDTASDVSGGAPNVATIDG